ncbi:MAG: gamma-glutamylcyclotransferase [Deltaproteobacteria bacterium]|nr:MAG: gamma-glutamylcyclotransferase [Deltaproteobacteria bacterium]
MYYFAYGSNMNWTQMAQRCPSARFVSVARLKDHRFAITRQSRRRLCGTADVLPESGSEVWGVVYQLDDCELGVLDGFEDGYGREKMYVDPIGDGRRPLEAWVYVAEKETCPPLPNGLYKRLIVEGARHWKLPEAYIEMLERLEVATE